MQGKGGAGGIAIPDPTVAAGGWGGQPYTLPQNNPTRIA